MLERDGLPLRTTEFSEAFNIRILGESFILDRKVQDVSKGTITFYRAKLKLFSKYCDGQGITELTQVMPDTIRGFLIYLADAGYNPGGRHAVFRTLRAFFHWVENEEIMPDKWKNPMRKLRAPKVPDDPLDPVLLPDVEKMLDVCDNGWHGERDRAIILTLLDTGVRASELLAINLGDYNSMIGDIFIRSGKGRKPRTVFVGKRTRRVIRSWLKHRGRKDGPLFTSEKGVALDYEALRDILARRSKKAGVPKTTAHDFRRAFCLSQLQAGVPETTIARLMGHTTTTLIARYAKQKPKDLRSLYHSPADENE